MSPRWTQPETIELLAHLDYIVGGAKKETYSRALEEYVLQQLQNGPRYRETSASNNRYTQAQIRGKLYFEFRKAHPGARYQFRNIFTQGTEVLRILNEDTRKSIENELQWITVREPRKARDPMTTDGETIKRATLPSVIAKGKMLSLSSSRDSPSMKRERFGSTPRSTPKRIISSELNILGKRARSTSSRNAPRKTQVVPKRGKDALPHHSAITPSFASPTHTDPGESKRRPDTIMAAENGCRAVIGARLLEDDGSEVRPHISLALNGGQHGENVNPNAILKLPFHSSSSFQPDFLELCADINRYRRKWNEAEIECENLKSDVRTWKSLAENVDGAYLDVQDEVRNLNRINDGLVRQNKQLRDQLRLQAYFRTEMSENVAESQNQTFKDIQTLHGKLLVHFNSLLVLNAVQQPEPRSLIPPELAILLSKVCGERFEKSIQDDDEFLIQNYTGVHTVLWCVIGAAVVEWVFQEDFEAFRCTTLMNTPLLDEYRFRIRLMGGDNGEQALHNLDFVCHQSVIEKAEFKEVFLPRTAAKLSKRILKVLEPYTRKNLSARSKEGLKDIVESIFNLALQLRVFIMTQMDIYECIWPTRDAPFDGTLMDGKLSEGAAACQHGILHNNCKIKVPLIPGFQLCNGRNKMVDYSGCQHINTRLTNEISPIPLSNYPMYCSAVIANSDGEKAVAASINTVLGSVAEDATVLAVGITFPYKLGSQSLSKGFRNPFCISVAEHYPNWITVGAYLGLEESPTPQPPLFNGRAALPQRHPIDLFCAQILW
ncbi:hypothetical protein CC78DRAFT_587319 [Lojkania enalia]|uniref:Uncharacterized protein n=1 Tax=Lojkania enalia TaxID=147567 RepID=A0A9P4K2H0_9PLEO|nr:hypothetical protein CC78DRAFT_587319 [Didymosphaeria enalia]